MSNQKNGRSAALLLLSKAIEEEKELLNKFTFKGDVYFDDKHGLILLTNPF